MKYLLACAIIAMAFANHLVSGPTVGGAWPGHWGNTRVVGGGLTDWNHDGIPDQWEGNWHGWNGWNNWNHWGSPYGQVLTDFDHDGIPDQWEGRWGGWNNWNNWNGWNGWW